MARSLYPTIFCSTLVLLAMICLRPNTARNLLDFASKVRAQSADLGDAPPPTVNPPDVVSRRGGDPFGTTLSPPAAPTTPRRAGDWPGGTQNSAPAGSYVRTGADSLVYVGTPPSGQASTTPANSVAPTATASPPSSYIPTYPATGPYGPVSPYAVQAQYTGPAPPATGAYPATSSYPATNSYPAAGPTYSAPAGSATPPASYGPPTGTWNAPGQSAPPPAAPPNFGSQGGPALQYGPPPAAQAPVQPPLQVLENAQIIARVGSEVIFAADLMGRYAQYQSAVNGGATREQIEAMRTELSNQLKNLVEIKLLFLEASKTIPADGLKEIQKRSDDQFDTDAVKRMLDSSKISSRTELDAKLHEYGTSLDRRRHDYFEQNVARMWLEQSMKTDEVQYGDMLSYYQAHLTEYDFQAQVRWEQLLARFTHFPGKEEAYQAIVGMGNDVLRGVPFADVAKARSQGPTADKGGQRDWTLKGSLRSTVMERTLFGLPVGAMSQIVEDDDGYHIVRVIERKEAGRTSFREAQVGIKKKLVDERKKKGTDDYLAKLYRETPVWTVFDRPNGSDSQISSRPSGPTR